jgi:hypothetical protein
VTFFLLDSGGTWQHLFGRESIRGHDGGFEAADAISLGSDESRTHEAFSTGAFRFRRDARWKLT